jgi:hypothetical protein
MTDKIAEALARMQTKRTARATVWQNPNGTWSHHRDGNREWSEESACRIDLRFHLDHDKCVFTD